MIEYISFCVLGMIFGGLLARSTTRDVLRERYRKYLTRIANASDTALVVPYPADEANKRLAYVAHVAYVALGVRDEDQDPEDVQYFIIGD